MPPFFGANQRLMPSPRQMIISIVPFQRIHKIRNLRVPIDHQALHSRNFRKMPGMCRRQSLAKPRMMRGSREDPGSSRHLEVGFAYLGRNSAVALRGNFVAFRDGDIPHVVAEPGNSQLLGVVPRKQRMSRWQALSECLDRAKNRRCSRSSACLQSATSVEASGRSRGQSSPHLDRPGCSGNSDD
jgi:hypothetical protein